MTRDRRAIRGWAVVGGGLVLLAGAVAWWWEQRAASFALPGRLPVDRVVAELAAALPDSRQAPLAPRRGLLASAGPRDALIAPPGSRLPLRLRVPAEAVLAFSVGVEGDGVKDRRASGVRFGSSSTAWSASRGWSTRRPAVPTGSGSTSTSSCPARRDARSRSSSRPTSRVPGHLLAHRDGAA